MYCEGVVRDCCTGEVDGWVIETWTSAAKQVSIDFTDSMAGVRVLSCCEVVDTGDVTAPYCTYIVVCYERDLDCLTYHLVGG